MPEKITIRVAVTEETRSKARLLAALWNVRLHEAIDRALSISLEQAKTETKFSQ